MADGTGTKLATILWFVAALLAAAAAAVTYGLSGEIKWPLLAAALFLVVMGANGFKRSKGGGA